MAGHLNLYSESIVVKINSVKTTCQVLKTGIHIVLTPTAIFFILFLVSPIFSIRVGLSHNYSFECIQQVIVNVHKWLTFQSKGFYQNQILCVNDLALRSGSD